jgi:hypothetical protein
MNTLLHGMMNRANLIAPAGQEPASVNLESQNQNYRSNRQARRQLAKIRLDQRWDKKLAKHYGIPKMWQQYATQYGSSTEMLLSELLQQGAIEYKAMTEDGDSV